MATALVKHVVVSIFCDSLSAPSPGAGAEAPGHHAGPLNAEHLGGNARVPTAPLPPEQWIPGRDV
jgi:hypothetical protein